MNSPSSAEFVDDLNLVESRRTSEPSKLKDDLDSLSNWTEENMMKLNPTKCKAVYIRIARNPPPPSPLSINGHVLEVVPIAKCLGVIFQVNLGWVSQVTEMTKKGNQRLYLLCKLRQFNLPVEDLLTVYKCFVRPVLEYAAPVWHGGLTNGQRKKIENIQRPATRIILGSSYYSYSLSCQVLNLEKLNDRRDALCLKFAKSLYASDEYRHWLPKRRGDVSGRVTRQNNQLVTLPVHTERYRNSPIPYLTTLLNNSM